jgi:hypothetical protein
MPAVVLELMPFSIKLFGNVCLTSNFDIEMPPKIGFGYFRSLL